MARIEIDNRSGFCFGVVTAIAKAEEELSDGGQLYCIGDIVHNNAEVDRLRLKGLETIDHDTLPKLRNAKVLLRAHGEPPSTYATARANGVTIVDATCPVVLKLQQRIKASWEDPANRAQGMQLVIYGKRGHAEVNGLVGQTGGQAVVIENPEEIEILDFSRPIALYSQTTKSIEGFNHIIEAISQRMQPGVRFEHYDTICRQVSNRVDHLRQFAASHTVVIFVAGAKSSNGRVLLNHCLDVNPRSHLVPDAASIDPQWFDGAESIGICGATSTPRWLMEEIANAVKTITNE